MNLTGYKSLVSKTLGRGGLAVQKHSPTVLTAVGVVGVVATTVMASRATLKLEEKVTKLELEVEVAKSRFEGQEQTQMVAVAYTRGVISIGKLYAPTVAVGVASIGCLLGAHGIMHKRNVALVGAYKAVEQGFAEYRKRVIDEFGEDKDEEFRHGKFETMELKNEETGETEVVKVRRDSQPSMYARFFDETAPNWSPNADWNRAYIMAQQQYANDMLLARGHVFLNDVYDSLGMERSQAGAVVGWVLGKGGDNFVDFGVFNGDSERARAFVNGDERAILLDFNVDGVVYDLI